jgi:multiple sugar transport system substrate-binding protein
MTRRGLLRSTAVGGAALGAGALAACAPGGAGGGTEARPRRGAPVEITFNTWYDGVTEPIVPLFKKFEDEHNIKVAYDINPANRDANRGGGMPKYTAWYVSGTAPDVVNGDNFSWSTFYNQGVILEISDYLKRDKIDLRRDYVLMGSEIWCGKTYAMPYDADPRAVYYNKTLLKQAGAKDPWDDLKGQWTFADLEEMMQKTFRVQGTPGTDVYGVRMDYAGMSEAMGMFVWTFGGTWADFDKMRYTLDSKESLEAHNFVYAWFNRKLVMPNAVSSELGGGEKAIGQGRAVFRVRAAASHNTIRKEIGGAFDYDIAPFPGRQKGQPGVTIVSGNPHTVSKTTKYPEESYLFARFLAGDDVQGFWAKEKIQLPTLKKWQAEYVKDDKLHTHVFADAYKVPYGIHFRHNNLVRHYSEYSAEMNNEVYAGKKTMSDALKALNARMSNEVEYGSCAPYKGMQVPIKP